MSAYSRRKELISSPRFIRGLKIMIFLFSVSAVIFPISPLLSLLRGNNRYKNIKLLDDSLSRLTGVLLGILLESYTIQDFNRFTETTELFFLQYEKTNQLLDGYPGFNQIHSINNYLSLNLREITGKLKTLEENSIQAGYMSMVERKYTIRYARAAIPVDGTDNVLISETADQIQFLILEVIRGYRREISVLINSFDTEKSASLGKLNAIVSLFVFIFFLSALLVFATSLKRSRITEEAAVERSENLAELVRTRTAVLERQNRELKETRNLLVEREKMAALGKVVAGIAHEVSTPLGVCVTAASYLGEIINRNTDTLLDRDELKAITRLILSNITRASDLIDGFKRVAVDETSGVIRSFDLVSYLKSDLIPSISSLLEKKSHKVKLNTPDICLMHSYPGAVAQVVTNLLINASIHGYRGMSSETITVQVECEEEQVVITVSDQGRGMDEETRLKIFEPFFTTGKEEGGSGLGMMVVYNLVNEKLQGSLDCRTTPGKGTDFTIRIPHEIKDTSDPD